MTSPDKRYLGGGLRIASGSAAPLRLDHGYFEHEVRPMLGSILVQKGWITHERLDAALQEVKVTGMRLGDTLLSRGWLFEPALPSALAEQDLPCERRRCLRVGQVDRDAGGASPSPRPDSRRSRDRRVGTGGEIFPTAPTRDRFAAEAEHGPGVGPLLCDRRDRRTTSTFIR